MKWHVSVQVCHEEEFNPGRYGGQFKVTRQSEVVELSVCPGNVQDLYVSVQCSSRGYFFNEIVADKSTSKCYLLKHRYNSLLLKDRPVFCDGRFV